MPPAGPMSYPQGFDIFNDLESPSVQPRRFKHGADALQRESLHPQPRTPAPAAAIREGLFSFELRPPAYVDASRQQLACMAAARECRLRPDLPPTRRPVDGSGPADAHVVREESSGLPRHIIVIDHQGAPAVSPEPRRPTLLDRPPFPSGPLYLSSHWQEQRQPPRRSALLPSPLPPVPPPPSYLPRERPRSPHRRDLDLERRSSAASILLEIFALIIISRTYGPP